MSQSFSVSTVKVENASSPSWKRAIQLTRMQPENFHEYGHRSAMHRLSINELVLTQWYKCSLRSRGKSGRFRACRASPLGKQYQGSARGAQVTMLLGTVVVETHEFAELGAVKVMLQN
jgi:hypothetical protein